MSDDCPVLKAEPIHSPNPAEQCLTAAVVLFITLDAFAGFGRVRVAGYVFFLLAVLLLKSRKNIHLSILLLLIVLTPWLLPKAIASLPTAPLLVPLLISTVAVSTFPNTRSTLAWFKAGRLDTASCLSMAVIAVLSAIALVLWARAADNLGFGVQVVQRLGGLPPWVLFGVFIPFFALANAFTEEAVFRGVIQEALARTLNRAFPVLILQASAFAAFHFLAGFPNGYIGYLMALVYGIALGYLRVRTGGLLAPCVTHIFADLVIGYYLVIRIL